MGGPLYLYRVTVRGTTTVMQLTEADATAHYPGAVRIDDDATADTPAAKMRPPAKNKARTSQNVPNKGGGGGGAA